MLQARNLRKTYATDSGRVDAVRDISLRLEAGQFLAVARHDGRDRRRLRAVGCGGRPAGCLHPCLARGTTRAARIDPR